MKLCDNNNTLRNIGIEIMDITKVTNVAIELIDDERQPCEVWTRVMGYHRPVTEFNTGKQSEYSERVCFKEVRIGANFANSCGCKL